jgi:hypothetical protein
MTTALGVCSLGGRYGQLHLRTARSSYGEYKLWVIVTKKQGASAARKRPADTTVAASLDDNASAESAAGGAVVQPSIVVEGGAATDAVLVCAYASVTVLGCKSQTPSQDLRKCSERGCNTMLHRACFARHFQSQVEGIVCLFVFMSSTMRSSRYGLGASSPLITTPQYQR